MAPANESGPIDGEPIISDEMREAGVEILEWIGPSSYPDYLVAEIYKAMWRANQEDLPTQIRNHSQHCMSDDEDLADDLRIYGSCYWKMVDGKRVRVPMEKVRYLSGVAMEIDGEPVCSAERTQADAEGGK